MTCAIYSRLTLFLCRLIFFFRFIYTYLVYAHLFTFFGPNIECSKNYFAFILFHLFSVFYTLFPTYSFNFDLFFSSGCLYFRSSSFSSLWRRLLDSMVSVKHPFHASVSCYSEEINDSLRG